jgi:hypothetical protein
MARLHPSSRQPARRGVILMVVVVMLGLFAVIGIAFLLYSESKADSARIYREAFQLQNGTPPVPASIFNSAMSQLIYDVQDDQTGAFSAMRGNSLARSMYGYCYMGTPGSVTVTNPTNASEPLNNLAYSGPGRLHTVSNPWGLDDYSLPNYQYFATDKFARDPERYGTRANLSANPGAYIGMNAGYTYPDENNMYLAAVRAYDGLVMTPSFVRPYGVFGSLADPTKVMNPNPNWTNAQGKYMTLRPRPIDNTYNGISFPYPPANPDGTYTGDIQQLVGSSYQHNDSIWMDLDLPVGYWKGQYYKPLVAFLVIDLDGRINMNVAGNIKGGNGQNSAQGFGPWEMNVATVADSQNTSSGGQGLTWLDTGNGGITGRYSTGGIPNPQYLIYANNNTTYPNTSIPGAAVPFYSAADFDGSALTTGIGNMGLPPLYASNNTYLSNMTFGANYQSGSVNERTNHPLLYNPYLLSNLSSSYPNRDRTFGPSDMYYLNYIFNGGDTYYKLSQLGQLLPQNFGQSYGPGNGWINGASNPRFLATTVSNDVDRVGVAPFQTDTLTGGAAPTLGAAPTSTDYMWPNGVTTTTTLSGVVQAQPTGAAITFPNPGSRPLSPTGWTDFDANTWRSISAAIGAIDLNRSLTDYKDATTPWLDMAQTMPNVTTTTTPTPSNSYGLAVADRQRFAADIFERLCAACGTRLMTNMTVAQYTANYPSQYNALRFLAQLAVNIVDYIDNDDYMTPFAWNTSIGGTEVLFGTELPRLVINEVFARVDAKSGDMPAPNGYGSSVSTYKNAQNQQITYASTYGVNIWVELYNPLTPQTNATTPNLLPYGGGAPLWVNNPNLGNQNSSVYRIMTTLPNTTLRNLTNFIGTPDANPPGSPAQAQPVTFSQALNVPQIVATSNAGLGAPVTNNGANATTSANPSFVMFGPTTLPGTDGIVPTAKLPNLQYQITLDANGNAAGQLDAATLLPTPPTILLQRLACPELPYQNNQNQPFYNPYITVDYFVMQSGKDGNGNTAMNDGRQYMPLTGAGMGGGTNNNRVKINLQASYGKRQPYASYGGQNAADGTYLGVQNGATYAQTGNSQIVRQQLMNPGSTAEAGGADMGTMNHTFFRHNYQSLNGGPAAAGGPNAMGVTDTLDPRFDLLMHMDRKLVSPMEILNVSAYRPHELTQQFIVGPRYNQATWQANVNQHMTTWFGDTARLWRAMGLLETRSRIQGMGMGGRVPGKVNINTIWDQSIFMAMLDPNNSNHFSSADVNAMWTNLATSRDGQAPTSNAANGPNGSQLPFLGIATSSSAGGPNTPYSATYGSGIGSSPFRLLPNTAATYQYTNQQMINAPLAGALDPSQAAFTNHPYFKNEPLAKMFSNMTTRSNTFAVWMTVGYFQVTNGPGPFTTANRPILGPELGSTDGTVQRNKFFAVVDRTKLAVDMTVAARNVQGPPPIYFSYEPYQVASAMGETTLTDPDTTNGNAVQVSVPAMSNNNGSLQGVYDGTPWTISVGTQLLFAPDDVPVWTSPSANQTANTTDGSMSATPRRVTATVTQISNYTGPTGTNNGSALITVTFTPLVVNGNNTYPSIKRGTAMMIYNTTPGNPGPQANFNYQNPIYAPVVPYVIQVQ